MKPCFKFKAGRGNTFFLVLNERDAFTVSLDEAKDLEQTFSRLQRMVFQWPSTIGYVASTEQRELCYSMNCGRIGAVFQTVITFISPSEKHPMIEMFQWSAQDLQKLINQLQTYIGANEPNNGLQ